MRTKCALRALRPSKIIYYGEILYGFTAYATKLAILLLLNRIFGANRKMRWSIIVLAVSMGIFYILGILPKVFICTPIRRFWNHKVPGRCLNESAISFADCIMSIVSDFAILILPTLIRSTERAPRAACGCTKPSKPAVRRIRRTR